MSFTFTHGIIGWMIGAKLGKTKEYKILGLMAGMLPDLDGLLIFINYPLHQFLHRLLFHSIFYAAAIALLWMLIMKKKTNPFIGGTIIFSSFMAHILLDMISTSKGIALFAPLSFDLFWYPIIHFWYWPEVIICLFFILFMLKNNAPREN